MTDPFWESNSKQWVETIDSGAIASRAATSPAVIAAILETKPQAVLDVGCGEGWIAGVLKDHAVVYTGIDGSAALVAAARERSPHAAFEHVSYDGLAAWAKARAKTRTDRFDVVVFNFSLFDEDPRPTLKAVKGLLTARGRVVIQTLHPCFALQPYENGWRSEDFKSMATKFNGTMPWYGRTLGAWIGVFSDAGLSVASIAEPALPAAAGPASILFSLRQHDVVSADVGQTVA